MSDLLVFTGLVALMVAVGIALGIIVAARIDRITASRPGSGGAPSVNPDATADPVEEQA